MFKAIVFMSVIVSLAYSAPYGGYGGSGSSSFDGGLGKVRDIGISFDSGKGLGIGLEGKGMEMSFGTKDIGLGEVNIYTCNLNACKEKIYILILILEMIHSSMYSINFT